MTSKIETEAHYMRNMIGQAMSVIGQFCTTYQLFTSPKVYPGVWAMHPSIRTDQVYSEVLEFLDPKLAQMPWTRTNRSIRGATLGADAHLETGYHNYAGWVQGPLSRNCAKSSIRIGSSRPAFSIQPEFVESKRRREAARIATVEPDVQRTRYGCSWRHSDGWPSDSRNSERLSRSRHPSRINHPDGSFTTKTDRAPCDCGFDVRPDCIAWLEL